MTEQCEAVQPWLSAYIDEELDARRQAEVQAHLATCGVCRHELTTLRQTAQAMQAWCVPEANPQLSVVFAERLHAQHPGRAPWRARLAAAWPRLVWPAIGVLLLALLLGNRFIPRQTRLQTAKDHTSVGTQIAVNPVPALRSTPKATPRTVKPAQPPQYLVATRRPDVTNAVHPMRKYHRRIREMMPRDAASPAPTHEREPVVPAQGPAPVISTNPAAATPAASEANDLAIALITETPTPDDADAASTAAGATAHPRGTVGARHMSNAAMPPLIEASTDESPERVLLAYMTETN